jgi:hypothetical protein
VDLRLVVPDERWLRIGWHACGNERVRFLPLHGLRFDAKGIVHFAT